ncbi:MAG: copper transporter [Actinomycetes bacterium]
MALGDCAAADRGGCPDRCRPDGDRRAAQRVGRAVSSWRYRAVSMAVGLLALAIGLVLGAGPLLGPPVRRESGGSPGPLAGAGQSLIVDSGAAAYDQQWTAALVGMLVDGRLTGVPVSVVVLPGTPSSLVASTRRTLLRAGARLTVTVTVQSAWSDPTRTSVLADLASRLLPSGSRTPSAGTPQRAATVLASALVGATSPGAAHEGASAAILGGLGALGFITADPVVAGTARLSMASAVVLLAPARAPSGGTPSVTAPSVTATWWEPLADALASSSRALLVAAPLSTAPLSAGGSPGLVTDLQTASGRTPAGGASAGPRNISTLAGADGQQGQVSLVLALVEALAGHPGQYGLGSGATSGVLPPLPAGGPGG